MRRVLLVVASALALLGVAFLVAVPIVLERNLSADAVARRASDLFGRPVTVESVAVAFRPALRIRAEGIEAEGGGRADAVEVEIAVLPLLRRRVEPTELHLVRPTLFVMRAPDGGLHATLLALPERDSGGAPPRLPAVDARDGEIVLVEADGRPADAPRLEVLRLELGALGEGRPTRVELEVAVSPESSARWSLEAGRFEGAATRAGGSLRIESGRAEGRGLVVHGLAFDRFEGRFGYADGRVAVERLSLDAYGGALAASGTVQLGQPVRFDGSAELSGVDVSGLVRDWRGAPPPTALGSLEAEGELALRLAAGDRGTGEGRLALRDGRLPAGSIFSALLGTLGQLTGRLLSFGSAGAPSASRLESLTATWTLRDERLHSDDLVLVTDDYSYRAAGSLGLDRSLAFSGELQLTSRGLQRLLASAALPLPGASEVIPAIPVRVGGSLGSPSVRAEATALPEAGVSTLTGLVKGTARAGKGIVDRVIGR